MRALLLIALFGCSTRASTPSARSHPPSAPAHPPAARTAPVTIVPRGSIVVGRQVCAVQATGKVACWGLGGAGLYGTSGNADHPTPIEVPGVGEVVGLASGGDFMCAWTARGEAVCWGSDEGDYRAVGENDAYPPLAEGEVLAKFLRYDRQPRRVPQLDDVVQIVASRAGACGLRASGRVACWNRDAWRDPLWPRMEELDGLAGAVELAGDEHHLCARLTSGDVTCEFTHGDWRDGMFEFEVIPELAGATSLAGAISFNGNTDRELFAALLPGHRLATWSIEFGGQLRSAMAIHRIDGVGGERVVVSESEVCVLGAQGQCWSIPDLERPAADVLARARPLAPGVRDLAPGDHVSCARIGDRAECWGEVGRLGDGWPTLPTDFVAVKGITDAKQLEANRTTVCALLGTGRVACWGSRSRYSSYGEQAVDFVPFELPGVTDASEIAMSPEFVCARRKHRASCWQLDRWSFDREPDAPSETLNAPELASAVKLYSGPHICGVSARGGVGCTRSEYTDHGRCTMYIDASGAKQCKRTPDAEWHPPDLEVQLRSLLASGKPPCVTADGDVVCFHSAGNTELEHVELEGGRYAIRANGTVAQVKRAAVDPQPPIAALSGVVELRATIHVLCGRLRGGTVACWGARSHLGAGRRMWWSDDPVPVADLVMGPARQVTPARPAPPAPEPIASPRGKPVELKGRAMHGPYADAKTACAAEACPNHKTETYCDDELRSAAPGSVMRSPPGPFSDVRLVSFDCRPGDNPAGPRRPRLMVTRHDGVWLSEPLFVVRDSRSCWVTVEPRWETRAVASARPGVVLSLLAATSCDDATSNNDDEVAMMVIAGDARRPFTFAPIATGVAQVRGCADGVPGCTSNERTVRLVATFAGGGLVLDGAPTWPAILRDKTGTITIEGVLRDKTEPSTAGAYRFTAP